MNTNNENLRGSAFNDDLTGDDGNNRLLGGDGADRLLGGDGADEFVFSDGHDTTFNFSTTFDQVDLSGVAAITNFADLQANHLSEAGGSAVISDGDGNMLTFDGIAMADLTADDFIF